MLQGEARGIPEGENIPNLLDCASSVHSKVFLDLVGSQDWQTKWLGDGHLIVQWKY
jgi:hypothetical protein